MSPAVPQSVLDENIMELKAVQEGKEGRRTGKSLETSSQSSYSRVIEQLHPKRHVEEAADLLLCARKQKSGTEGQ